MRIVFTDITVRNLQASDKGQLKVWDTKLPGFGLVVGKRTKTFTVVYGKERRNKSIGRYPEISLSEARKEAKRLLATQPSKKAVTNLTDLVRAYLSDCQGRLRPNTVAGYHSVLQHAPDIPIDRATKSLVKTAHEIKAYKALFNWAIREELTDTNPFIHLSAVYGKRERVLTDDEIKLVWQYDYPPYSTIVKLLLLTGQRLNQISSLQPEWIDGYLIKFPANIMKNGNTHTIPFGNLTKQFITPPFRFNGWSNAKERMDRITGVTDYRLHDLRRTWATKNAEIGTPIHVAEAHLDHRSGTISGVAAVYFRHNWLLEMRKAVKTYEAHIAKLVGL